MSELRVLNRQKTRPIDLRLLKQIARTALKVLIGRDNALGSATVPVALAGVPPANSTKVLLRPNDVAAGPGMVFGETPKTTVETTALPEPNEALQLGREHYELGIHLVNAREMAAVNKKYLNHEGSTDVITFDYSEGGQSLHGEIFICIDDALIQAKQFEVSWQSEVVRYLVHGILHLEGFDDLAPALRKVMKRRENNLVKELSRQFDFCKISRRKRATR